MADILPLTGAASLGAAGPLDPNAKQPAPGLIWHYDDTEVYLIGHERAGLPKHRGEHMFATYKGHKLRILRVLTRVYPDSRVNKDVTQSWQGECDGVAVDGMKASHTNEVAERLLAHVDALPAA
jgi:hypothetical protein